MKLVKLSLVAALAAGAFSVANAAALEDVIKEVDVSGVLRYRYTTGRIERGENAGLVYKNRLTREPYSSSLLTTQQKHQYRAQLNFNSAIADNFKAFMQLNYSVADGGYGEKGGNVSVTTGDKAALHVRQLYLTYINDETATNVIFGKQQLNTIWTDNGVDGLVGTGVKIVNNSIDGLTVATFAVDSFNTDEQGGDIFAGEIQSNLYGFAAMGAYELMGGAVEIKPQFWLGYASDNLILYALDVAYGLNVLDGVDWKINAAYLGNSVATSLKPTYGDSNFFSLKGSVAASGFDASLGGLFYGSKTDATLAVIEDQGNLDLPGKEMFYTEGSNLNGDLGQNIFGYVTVGYTFDALRVGADFIYGGTSVAKKHIHEQLRRGGEKMEAVAKVDYKYSPKLAFSAWYSQTAVDQGFVDVKGFKGDKKGTKNAVRFQALYKF